MQDAHVLRHSCCVFPGSSLKGSASQQHEYFPALSFHNFQREYTAQSPLHSSGPPLLRVHQIHHSVNVFADEIRATSWFESVRERRPPTMTNDVVYYRSANLSQINMFYREAGDPSRPTMVLLHGFPTSSHMFRGLIPLLACFMHVVAPDFPGFGYTESPPAADFDYTFDHLANTVEELIQQLGISHFFVYIMDYGAPVGLRLMEAHPERILGLVVQNGIAHEQGLTPFWDPIRKYWKDRTPENEKALLTLFTFETTRYQYVTGAKDVEKISPDNWYLDYYFLQLPGHTQIQLDLFYDYQSNLERYPGFQATFRKYQFPTLIVWGKKDFIFGVPGAKAYLKDLPHAELHLLDGGHFVLEDHLKPIAKYILRFAKKVTARDN